MLLPLVLVLLSALSGVSYYFSKQALIKIVDDTAQAVGTDYSKRVQSNMEVLFAELNAIASIDFIRAGTDSARIMATMIDMKTRLGVFDTMTFVYPNGLAITPSGTSVSYAERDYFKKAIISEPINSRRTGKLAVVLVMPVIDNGQLTGAIIGNVPLDGLTVMIKGMQFLETGYGLISHASGQLIAYPKQPELVGKLVPCLYLALRDHIDQAL